MSSLSLYWIEGYVTDDASLMLKDGKRVTSVGRYISLHPTNGQMAERLGNRAINRKVTGLIPGRAK